MAKVMTRKQEKEWGPPRPLFIPLMREHFEAFDRGDKHVEFRIYGPRWNEKTCYAGREAVLSLGYGKHRRLNRTIASFGKLDIEGMTPAHKQILKGLYGEKTKEGIAAIYFYNN